MSWLVCLFRAAAAVARPAPAPCRVRPTVPPISTLEVAAAEPRPLRVPLTLSEPEICRLEQLALGAQERELFTTLRSNHLEAFRRSL